MSYGYFIIPKRITERQVAWNPQEVQTSHWMENLRFKGNYPFGLHSSHLHEGRIQTGATTIEMIESSHARGSTC